jgi:hypothetical protein
MGICSKDPALWLLNTSTLPASCDKHVKPACLLVTAQAASLDAPWVGFPPPLKHLCLPNVASPSVYHWPRVARHRGWRCEASARPARPTPRSKASLRHSVNSLLLIARFRATQTSADQPVKSLNAAHVTNDPQAHILTPNRMTAVRSSGSSLTVPRRQVALFQRATAFPPCWTAAGVRCTSSIVVESVPLLPAPEVSSWFAGQQY